MAATHNRNVRGVEQIQWTGSNLEAVVTFLEARGVEDVSLNVVRDILYFNHKKDGSNLTTEQHQVATNSHAVYYLDTTAYVVETAADFTSNYTVV